MDCKTGCGAKATMTGTQLCDGCHEIKNHLSSIELQIIVESLTITRQIVHEAKINVHFNRNDRNVQLDRVDKLKKKFEALL